VHPTHGFHDSVSFTKGFKHLLFVDYLFEMVSGNGARWSKVVSLPFLDKGNTAQRVVVASLPLCRCVILQLSQTFVALEFSEHLPQSFGRHESNHSLSPGPR
jgi:hypothetical protein